MFDKHAFHERTIELSEHEMRRPDRPDSFTLEGREWDLLPEVFPPVFRPSTRVSLDYLGLLDGGTFAWSSLLEIGCGAGVVATTAALQGCSRVHATDINPYAVENARRNAERHGVSDRVQVSQGDLFSDIDSSERFDLVFWNSNFIWAPEDYAISAVHEYAYLDPGYQAHRRFLEEAPRWTTESGSVHLLFSSSKGDFPEVGRLAEETGREIEVIRRETVVDGSDMAESEFLLIDVRDPGRR
ncbi:methyltransferase domain-containing protein [Pseudonocardia alni]|uniref:methyltransferase domain-containing protein n=1 Tax=Pseudonocardia alni TaxID=33907 RepID=UPI0033CDA805